MVPSEDRPRPFLGILAGRTGFPLCKAHRKDKRMGEFVSKADEIGRWGTDQERWLVVYPANSPEDQARAERLISVMYEYFYTEIGWIKAVKVGTQLYGSRFDNIILMNWAPEEPERDGMGQIVETRDQVLHSWWLTVLCRFGPGSWLRKQRARYAR